MIVFVTPGKDLPRKGGGASWLGSKPRQVAGVQLLLGLGSEFRIELSDIRVSAIPKPVTTLSKPEC